MFLEGWATRSGGTGRLTASCHVLSALNEGALEAAMAMGSPVRGFRPRRAACVLVAKVPNPATVTVSPLARALAVAVNSAVTAAVALAYESDSAAATCEQRSERIMMVHHVQRCRVAPMPVARAVEAWRGAAGVRTSSGAHSRRPTHFFASRALSLGESLPMIGKLLGHGKIQTTVRYAHLARDSVKAAAERVSYSLGADLDSPPS